MIEEPQWPASARVPTLWI